MFIIFDKLTKQIHSYGIGKVEEYNGKLYSGEIIVCNDLDICGWKYIDTQKLEYSTTGFLHDADYYQDISESPTIEQRMDALENSFLEDVMSRLI